MDYPTLSAYKNGSLGELWQHVTGNIAASDETLSPLRAGELAAARLASAAGHEYERLEQAIHGELTDQEADLYNFLAITYELKRELIDLSGTRTLLVDMLETSLEL